jgi:hypothetical protein
VSPQLPSSGFRSINLDRVSLDFMFADQNGVDEAVDHGAQVRIGVRELVSSINMRARIAASDSAASSWPA